MYLKFDFYNSIKNVIDSLYSDNKINHETVLIIPVHKKGIEDIFKSLTHYKNKFILVSKDKIDINSLDDKIEVIYIPNNFKNEELLLMANDIKEEYDNSYILDLSSNLIYEKSITKGLCKDIFSKYNDLKEIYVPYVYGGLYKAVYSFFKLMSDVKIILINYQNEEVNKEIDYDLIIDFNHNINDNNNIIIII